MLPLTELPPFAPAVLDRIDKKASLREATAALAAVGRQPVYPLEFCSQFGEDALIWALTGQPLAGFFIEVGAFDGYTLSATYALECIGWTGLLVEAIPDRFAQCRERRIHSRVVHAALGRTTDGESTFNVTADGHGGLFSHVEGATGVKGKVRASVQQTVSVPNTTLDQLLRDHTGEIDAAVIDVEGVELELLAGFDLRAHAPKMLLIEDNSRGADPALHHYMSSMPYTSVGWLKVNRVYVREDLAETWIARLPQPTC